MVEPHFVATPTTMAWWTSWIWQNLRRTGSGKNLDAGSFSSGLIGDVRIYNQALSAKEIEELMC